MHKRPVVFLAKPQTLLGGMQRNEIFSLAICMYFTSHDHFTTASLFRPEAFLWEGMNWKRLTNGSTQRKPNWERQNIDVWHHRLHQNELFPCKNGKCHLWQLEKVAHTRKSFPVLAGYIEFVTFEAERYFYTWFSRQPQNRNAFVRQLLWSVSNFPGSATGAENS